jgi:peptidoglycan/xylan/chitin deacetylase (PgdA/CDA1 family)
MRRPSVKELVKAGGAYATDAVRRPDGARRAVILCYHSVHPSKGFASATPALFDEHLSWLREFADVVPLAEIRRRAQGENRRPLVAVTFDDGYEDNWSYAFPALVRHGLPATFFLTAGLIQRDPAVLRRFSHVLRRTTLGEVAPLSWAQIREMRSGGADFGSHTYGHPNLGRAGAAAVQRELVISRQILEDGLEEPVRTLAYPFGKPRRHVTRATMQAAADTGYECAVVVASRAVRPSDDAFGLPRFIVSGDDLPTLRRKVVGAFDFVASWQERAPLWAVRLLLPKDDRL